MKKIYNFFAILIISVIFSSVGCSNSGSENIIGKWVISDYKTDKKMNDKERVFFEGVIEDYKANYYLEFNVDKSFLEHSGDKDSPFDQKGTWELLASDEVLRQTYEGGRTVQSQIQSLSNSEFLIVQKDENSGSTIVLTLKKQ